MFHTKCIAACLIVLSLASCRLGDPNMLPELGEESRLPANCRAYVQWAIDDYRMGKYTADQTFAGLERNCGMHGQLWSHKF